MRNLSEEWSGTHASKWAVSAYEYLLSKWELFGRGYIITIGVTVIGVLACITITLMFGYMLSRPGLPAN